MADRSIPRRILLALLALAGIVAVLLAPGWEADLLAQNYDEFSTISSEVLRDAEFERRDISNRIDAARNEGPTRKWGVFLTLDRNTIERSGSRLENGFDSHTPGFLVGLDRRLLDALLLGAAAGFKVTDLEFDDVPKGKPEPRNPHQLGDQRTYTGTIGPYLSYTPGESWYLNGSVVLGFFGTSTKRFGDGLQGTAKGDTRGYRVSVAGGGGYEWRYRALRAGPHLDVAWDHVHTGGFQESGIPGDRRLLLAVSAFDDDLVTVKSGGRFSYAFPFSWGVLLPTSRLDFVYRNLDQSKTGEATRVDGSVTTFEVDRPDRTSIELGVGLQLALPHELTLWAGYEENFLERFYTRSRVTAGVRKQF
jgi:outer membrane autotransporter protein